MITQDEAKQLRIGNIVTYHSDEGDMECVLDAQDIYNIAEDRMGNCEVHSFIPLSEDLLLRIDGFECIYKSSIHSLYSLGDGTISYYFWYGTGNNYLSIVGTKFICKTLHHLQNIVMDLTGQELTLKTK